MRSAELNEAVESVVSSRFSDVSGTLKLSAPPSVSDTLLTPSPRFGVLSERPRPDPCHRASGRSHRRGRRLGVSSGRTEGFRAPLVARRVLTYRHQLVASPSYLRTCKPPKGPRDLLDHRLLTFSHWKPENCWTFVHKNGVDKETLTFQPHFSMNDYTGLAPALAAGAGIGELRQWSNQGSSGKAVWSRSSPDWRFRT